MKHHTLPKITLSILFAILTLMVCVGAGSVPITPAHTLSIIAHKLFAAPLNAQIPANQISILWEIRMPRAFTAFAVGGALSVSGAVMQSLLQNPLASSYTLGVSSGASLGAAIIIVMEITSPFFGVFLLPAAGFAFGLATVFLVIFFSSKLDSNLKNHTIILFGMVLSLFVNAILTMLSAAFSQHLQRLTLWQMGSFAGRRWNHVAILMGVCVAGTLLLTCFHRELDLMSFGEEQSAAVGVDTRRVKVILLVLTSLMTGAAVCFTGVIGFIDLTVPHVVRRIFGSAHKLVLPMSVVLGGAFMAIADLLARTLLSPQDIPVGAVTALIGAPFFLFVYFGTRRSAQ